MNMFKPVKAKTVQEYFDALPPDRRQSMEALHHFIQKAAPSLKSHFAYNMLGYGSFTYTNYKKETIAWPTVSVASQKNYISIYICAIENGEYVAEKYKHKLGNVSVGKSCIRFKTIEDVHLEELKKVIQLAEKTPGLAGVGASAKKRH